MEPASRQDTHRSMSPILASFLLTLYRHLADSEQSQVPEHTSLPRATFQPSGHSNSSALHWWVSRSHTIDGGLCELLLNQCRKDNRAESFCRKFEFEYGHFMRDRRDFNLRNTVLLFPLLLAWIIASLYIIDAHLEWNNRVLMQYMHVFLIMLFSFTDMLFLYIGSLGWLHLNERKHFQLLMGDNYSSSIPWKISPFLLIGLGA